MWMRMLARGKFKALEELRHWQTRLGEPPQEASDNDPHSIVATTIHLPGEQPEADALPGSIVGRACP